MRNDILCVRFDGHNLYYNKQFRLVSWKNNHFLFVIYFIYLTAPACIHSFITLDPIHSSVNVERRPVWCRCLLIFSTTVDEYGDKKVWNCSSMKAEDGCVKQ
jgi:hypothetical protein